MGLPINAYHYMETRRKLSDNKEFRLRINKYKLSSNKIYHDDRTLLGESYSYNKSIKDICYDHNIDLTGNDIIDGITKALRSASGMNHSLNEISKMSEVLKGDTIRKPRELRIPQRISRLGLLYNPYGLID